MTATLGGHAIKRGTIETPKTGVWSAQITLATAEAVSGSTILSVSGVSRSCSVIRGGAFDSGATYTIVGGAGGWRQPIPGKPYRNDAGIKLSTVLRDAAAAAVGPGGAERISLDTDKIIGTIFLRRSGPAENALGRLVKLWWLADDGTTIIGSRPTGVVDTEHKLVSWDKKSGVKTILTENPLAILPGLDLDGTTIDHVIVDLDQDKVRVRVRVAGSNTDLRSLVARLVRRELAKLGIMQGTEYRVVQQSGPYVDLQIVRKTSGLPDAARVRARPCASGYSMTYTLGSMVTVMFAEGDPTRGFIAFGGDVGADGTKPQDITIDASGDINIADAVKAAIRELDTIEIDGAVVPGPSGSVIGVVKFSGPSIITHSRVKV